MVKTIVIQDSTDLRTVYERIGDFWIKFYEDLDLNRTPAGSVFETEILNALIQVLHDLSTGRPLDVIYVDRLNMIFINIFK